MSEQSYIMKARFLPGKAKVIKEQGVLISSLLSPDLWDKILRNTVV